MSGRTRFFSCIAVLAFYSVFPNSQASELQVALFEVDASPPIGSPLAYDRCIEVTDPLSCRGMVLLGAGDPIVICSVDWLGIANDSHLMWRSQLAKAVGTTAERVALHTIHQHDAPRCDLTAAAVLAEVGAAQKHYDVPWIRDVIARSVHAATECIANAKNINGLGLGSAELFEVASNRRILGADGKVVATRYTACTDPALRAMPVGTVDATLRAISLWQDDTPVVILTYFATHPQSYYRTGKANPDFPGYARNERQKQSGIPHIHLNGAGGNIGAGKWNDGSHEYRKILSDRVADGMRRAVESTKREPLAALDVDWRFAKISLPVGKHLQADSLKTIVDDENKSAEEQVGASEDLAWLKMNQSGHKTDIQCLKLGSARILHMPGELFVEYQLAAASMRPDLFVAMAAYGDYGPGYIGTRIAYDEGGYETSPRASRVSSDVEELLLTTMRTLLTD